MAMMIGSLVAAMSVGANHPEYAYGFGMAITTLVTIVSSCLDKSITCQNDSQNYFDSEGRNHSDSFSNLMITSNDDFRNIDATSGKLGFLRSIRSNCAKLKDALKNPTVKKFYLFLIL